MSFVVIGLLILSAALHTGWNLILKQAGEKYMATWWSVLIGAVIFLPVLIFTGLPVRETWGLLAVSTLVEISYYIILATAYKSMDFSLVYPLARGAAPAMIAAWSVIFLGERLNLAGGVGVGMIIAGLLAAAGGGVFWGKRETVNNRGLVFALLLAFLISVYSTIDGAAVKHTAAFPYAVMIFFLAPLVMSPVMVRVYGWGALLENFQIHKGKLIATGLMVVLAYLLALAAYATAPVSYVGAIREISVVFGALSGWLFLKEPMGKWRVAGSLVIFAGILLIAFAG